MRIGVNGRFLAAGHPGGVQRFAFEVTSRLAERCPVTLFVPAGAGIPDGWSALMDVTPGMLRGHAWEQLELPLVRSADVLFHPANTAPVLAGRPQVLVLHDVFPLVRPQWYSGGFTAARRMMLPATVRRAARILTPSDWSAREIASALNIDAGAIGVVPQGLSPFEHPLPPDRTARILDAIRVRSPYILVIGEGDRRKNLPFAAAVMDALRLAHGSAPRLVVVGAAPRRVFGSGPGAAASEEPAHVRLGRVSDEQLHALYTGAAAVLCPSLAEGFGRVPLEAMACGAPCLVADRGAAAEVLAGSPAHLLPLVVDAWVATLRAVLAGGERVRDAERAVLRRRWSWDAAASGVLDACAAAIETAPHAVRAGVS